MIKPVLEAPSSTLEALTTAAACPERAMPPVRRGGELPASSAAEAQSVSVEGASNRGRRVRFLCGNEVQVRPIDWLWPGWLARGKLHLLAGEPSAGKTTLTLALTVPITTGGRWPDGTSCEPGEVVMWSGEDDVADTLVPRLKAMGADLRRVHFVSGLQTGNSCRPFDPAKDIGDLARAIKELSAPSLLIVDPIVNAVGGDCNKTNEVRRALAPLVDLASREALAVIGITHFTKGSGERSPIERVIGSGAFGALARMVLVAAQARTGGNEARILSRAKSNSGPEAGGFEYFIEGAEIERGIVTSRLLWGERVQGTAKELLANVEGTSEGQSALDEAAEWLKELLEDGPVDSNEVKHASGINGHSWASVRRAKKQIGARSKKSGINSGWSWFLPTSLVCPQGGDAKTLSPFEENEHLRGQGDDGDESQECLASSLRSGPVGPKVLRTLEDAQALPCSSGRATNGAIDRDTVRGHGLSGQDCEGRQ